MNTMQSAFAEVGIVRTRRVPNPPKKSALKPYKREPVMWKSIGAPTDSPITGVYEHARTWGVSRNVQQVAPTYTTRVRVEHA